VDIIQMSDHRDIKLWHVPACYRAKPLILSLF